MTDKTPVLPSSDELSQLPLKAIVAYAVRAARRVQPLCVKGWSKDPDIRRDLIDKLDRVLTLASDFLGGRNVFPSEIRVAKDDFEFSYVDPGFSSAAEAAISAYNAVSAAAHAAGAADHAATAAAEAANHATTATAEDAVNVALRRDFELLLKRNAENPSTLKRSVATSERGFLGKLWPDGPPGTRNSSLSSMPSSKAKTTIPNSKLRL